MKRLRAAALALASLLLAAPVPAQEVSGTLKKIRESGSIALGHRVASIPFSYYDERQQVVGYSHELMLKVVDAVKAELKLDSLQIRLVPVTPQNRIALVQNGSVDLECGSTTNNRERAGQVAFSNNIFVIGTRLLTRRESALKDYPDLAGKSVVTTAGTTSERLLRRMNEERDMKMSILSAKDHGEAFLALESGRAAAFMMDDALLYGEMAKARKPGDWVVTGTPRSHEAYACMMRRGDAAFKRVVDAALAQVMTSGEAERIYARWFLGPVPPKGLNLNFPMSEEVKALYRAPGDKPYDD